MLRDPALADHAKITCARGSSRMKNHEEDRYGNRDGDGDPQRWHDSILFDQGRDSNLRDLGQLN